MEVIMATLDPGVTGKRRRGAARGGRPRKRTGKIKRYNPPAGSPFMSIPQAGAKFFGLSKNGSYDAAERGDFGELYEVGRRKFVVVPAIEAKIKAAAETQASKSTKTAA
jgi:hypothetical protein